MTANAQLIFLAMAITTFSPWLIRNCAWTRNPVFPEATSIFGKAHLSDAQVERWKRAHSPREDQERSFRAHVALARETAKPLVVHVREAWPETLKLGTALPQVPLWLGANLCVPVRLEESYMTTCRSLRMALWI